MQLYHQVTERQVLWEQMHAAMPLAEKFIYG
jgi:hypothetical protein